MQTINKHPPLCLTPEQRRLEVAILMALGLARLHLSPGEASIAESGLSLAISARGSVHDHTDNHRKVTE